MYVSHDTLKDFHDFPTSQLQIFIISQILSNKRALTYFLPFIQGHSRGVGPGPPIICSGSNDQFIYIYMFKHAGNYSQKSGNPISEILISKTLRGSMPPPPPPAPPSSAVPLPAPTFDFVFLLLRPCYVRYCVRKVYILRPGPVDICAINLKVLFVSFIPALFSQTISHKHHRRRLRCRFQTPVSQFLHYTDRCILKMMTTIHENPGHTYICGDCLVPTHAQILHPYFPSLKDLILNRDMEEISYLVC